MSRTFKAGFEITPDGTAYAILCADGPIEWVPIMINPT